MKQIIYCGSTSDGYEYYMEIDTENNDTGNVKQLRRKIGEFYLEPVNNNGKEVKGA